MKLSEYLKGRREVEEVEGKVREAEEKYKEAQNELKKEKEELKDKMKTEKKPVLHKLKPWTRHDLLLLILIIALFTTSMFFPRQTATTPTEAAEETEKTSFFSKLTGFFSKEKVEETKETEEETPPETATTECTENWECTGWTACPESGKQTRTCTDSNNCGTTENKPAEEQDCTYIPPVKPGPRFTLKIEDKEGNQLSSIKVSGSNEYEYRLRVENLEPEEIFCQADRDINGDVMTNFFKNWRVDSREQRMSPTIVRGEGKEEIEYTFRCLFKGERDETEEKAKLTVEFT